MSLMIDPLDTKLIELDSLMEEGLWYCENKPRLIKEEGNVKTYELADGTIMTLTKGSDK